MIREPVVTGTTEVTRMLTAPDPRYPASSVSLRSSAEAGALRAG